MRAVQLLQSTETGTSRREEIARWHMQTICLAAIEAVAFFNVD
jgi:hypothetical protein